MMHSFTLPSIVTVKVQLLLFPLLSVAVNRTVWTPMSKIEPDVSFTSSVIGGPELSVTVALGHMAVPFAKPRVVLFITSAGHVMFGRSSSEMENRY